jgi:hypothetical protein
MKNFENFRLNNAMLKTVNGGNVASSTIIIEPTPTPNQAQDFNSARSNRGKGNH